MMLGPCLGWWRTSSHQAHWAESAAALLKVSGAGEPLPRSVLADFILPRLPREASGSCHILTQCPGSSGCLQESP